MLRFLLVIGFSAGLLPAHDVITTAITFNREVVRILNERCASCHRKGGTAFSLATYNEARPWAVAIKEEILRRRMPPWGAVKGFGEFRNDQGLSAEEIEVLLSWIDGGVPEGKDKDYPEPPKFPATGKAIVSAGALIAGTDYKLPRAFKLDGLQLKSNPPPGGFRLTAELPNGSVEPLLWLDSYRPEFGHPFLFRKALDLPPGTLIRGLPPGGAVYLLPAGPANRAAVK